MEEEDLAEQEEQAVNGIAVKRDMDFPESLSKKTNVINITSNNNSNWAIMAANASAIAIPKLTIVKPVIHTNNNNNNNTQWADDSDDEQQDEDQDEDEEEDTQIQIPTYTQTTFVDYNVYEDEW